MEGCILYILIAFIIGIVIGLCLSYELIDLKVVGSLIEEKNIEYRTIKDPVTGMQRVEEIETSSPLYFLRISPDRVKWIHDKKYIKLKVVHRDDNN